MLLPLALAISTVLSAQGAWLSAWGGGGVGFYDGSDGVGSEWVTGVRFGVDLDPSVRVLLGLEYGENLFRFGRAVWTDSSVEDKYTYRGRELHLQMLFAFRLAEDEKQETRLFVGPELQLGSLRIERESITQGITSVGDPMGNEENTGGLRFGLRHARNIQGPLWVCVEPWVGLSLGGTRSDVTTRPTDLPMRVATAGVLLGLELGPRTTPKPQ
ncbi:MAG: hypothetical protein WEC15_06540 [Flavobacteriales bacterium]